MKNYTFKLNTDISESTYIRFKTILYPIINSYVIERFTKIGGEGIRVQLDETVICKRRRIINPTSNDYYTRETIWLFGEIEETCRKKFFMVVVENRTVNVLKNAINRNILPGTILVTDGYPSYPSVARELSMNHIDLIQPLS